MTRVFLFCASIILAFSSCKKESECDKTESISIYVEKDVQEGWPLKLYFQSDTYYSMEVVYPNGVIRKFGDEDLINNNYLILADSATPADNGKYTLRLLNKNCLRLEGSDVGEVIPTPTPPCPIQNNTGISTIGSIGGGSYYGVNSAGSSESDFHVVGYTSSLWHMNFRFNSDNPPRPGLYKSISAYSAIGEDENKCAVYFVHTYDEFLINADQDVYVNYVDGKLVLTLCSAEFNNEVSSSDLLISVKLILD